MRVSKICLKDFEINQKCKNDFRQKSIRYYI